MTLGTIAAVALCLLVAVIALRAVLLAANERARRELARMIAMYPDAYAAFRDTMDPKEYIVGNKAVNYAFVVQRFHGYLQQQGHRTA
jgi:hypothetical protein